METEFNAHQQFTAMHRILFKKKPKKLLFWFFFVCGAGFFFHFIKMTLEHQGRYQQIIAMDAMTEIWW